jgi:hypothetical protein
MKALLSSAQRGWKFENRHHGDFPTQMTALWEAVVVRARLSEGLRATGLLSLPKERGRCLEKHQVHLGPGETSGDIL